MIRILAGSEACDLVSRRRGQNRSRDEQVLRIIDEVRTRGDAALREYASRWDNLGERHFRVDQAEIQAAREAASVDYVNALENSRRNIRRFAEWQKPGEWKQEMQTGLIVGQVIRAIGRVGAYVPGGVYPLPSTLLMTVIPAQVAGVEEIVVMSPQPAQDTLAAAGFLGVNEFFRIGGAQAIAALAFGTESIPKVDKIVGPGNAYVAAAKRLLAGEVAIDSVAGPSEVVIVADEGRADWIAADLLAQAEHDADASSILITTNSKLADEVASQIEFQLVSLSTCSTAMRAIETNGAILVSDSTVQSMEWVNLLAPEHLCLHDPELLGSVKSAGSVFLGPWSTESLGDYASGPNHVLPTGGDARTRGGLSVTDFVKVITVQEASFEGLWALAPSVATLARAEGLEAHARAVEVRL